MCVMRDKPINDTSLRATVPAYAGDAQVDVTIKTGWNEETSAGAFRYAAPKGVERVALAGSFNGWSADATPMTRGASDIP